MDQRLESFTFRLTRAERRLLNKAAKAEKVSVATFVRTWVLDAAANYAEQAALSRKNGSPSHAGDAVNDEPAATPAAGSD